MGNGVTILFCMALFVLLTEGANLSNGDDFRSESKIHSPSEKAVEGRVASRKKRDFGISAAAIQAATGFISAGTSLATDINSLMSTGVSITIGIEMENYSKWRLVSPRTYLVRGHVKIPARSVNPGKREAMVAHKHEGTATGSFGTVSWLVGNNSGKRVIVMWAVPYDKNVHSNCLAVGIIDDAAVGPHWTSDMYYGRPGRTFSRAEFHYHVIPTIFCDATMCVNGTMGTHSTTVAHISVYPKNINNLAEQVRSGC